ncbi:MAG: steroid 5-alpha reductase family enzyme [Hyphomicrobiaceae bacterium]|jgi:steroid 5-alpha reductase family enzyme
MDFTELLLLNAAVITTLMLSLWVASLALRDASIVDAFWGMGFVLVAAADYLAGDGWQPRMVTITLLIFIWGLRLSLHLAQRNFGQPEDYRYQAMRRRWGVNFPWISLIVVFGLQGVLLWLIAIPIAVVSSATLPDVVVWSDLAGIVLWIFGFAFEAVSDAQLSAFKAQPSNRERVMEVGLWRWTRHPNYFGDATLWWGIWLIAASAPGGFWAVGSPVLMTWLLMRVSGVPLLEKHLARTREGYADYVARTPQFFPRPPR